MDEIQKRFDNEWRRQFPLDEAPVLVSLHSDFQDDMPDKRPREILQKLYNITRKRSEDLKNQVKQCEFIEDFLQGVLSADNDGSVSNRKSSEIRALEDCVRETLKVSAGIVLESNIDDLGETEESQHLHVCSNGSLDNCDLTSKSWQTRPPNSELITTQKCDKTSLEGHESGNVDHSSSNQINPSIRHEVTTHIDPLPREFPGTTKKHPRPAVPPRKSERSSDILGIEVVPIKSVSGPIFKSSVNIIRDNSTFKSPYRETDLDSDSVSNNISSNSRLEDNHSHNPRKDDRRKQVVVDNSDSDSDEMRKGRKSSGNTDQNVIATSFRKIGNDNHATVQSGAKNSTSENINDHLSILRKGRDKPPGIPERKPSADMSNSVPDAGSPRKRIQSRNNYENVSLDFILTRSQTFNDDSPDSEGNDEEDLYDNVTSRKPYDKAGNNESSHSSGGDNSPENQSPRGESTVLIN